MRGPSSSPSHTTLKGVSVCILCSFLEPSCSSRTAQLSLNLKTVHFLYPENVNDYIHRVRFCLVIMQPLNNFYQLRNNGEPISDSLERENAWEIALPCSILFSEDGLNVWWGDPALKVGKAWGLMSAPPHRLMTCKARGLGFLICKMGIITSILWNIRRTK